jgi:3-phytase
LTALLLSVVYLAPTFATASVSSDADDPAIWVNRRNPAQSRIYGTNKEEFPIGSIYAFDLNGRVTQTIDNVDRPNNIDVAYAMPTGNGSMDIAVATERLQGRLRIWQILPDGTLFERTGNTRVIEAGRTDYGEPMGVALYKRFDGSVRAYISPKLGPRDAYIQEYLLRFNRETNLVDAEYTRSLGQFSGKKEIEALAVDGASGYLYASDETFGTRKIDIDPRRRTAYQQVALFNTRGWKGDHEGVAIYGPWLITTDQIDGGSIYHLHPRNGLPGRPHAHPIVASFTMRADATDGIDATNTPLGPRFPAGIFVAMNSGPRNFLVLDGRRLQTLVRNPAR